MPLISSFYGIDIKIYFKDHFPAYFHAYYGEHSVEIVISDLSVLAGHLPRRAMVLVKEWAELHRRELEDDWEEARAGRPLSRIEPLP